MSRRNFGNVPQRRRFSRFGRTHLVDNNGEDHDGSHFYHHGYHGYHDPQTCPTCIQQRQRAQQRRQNKKPCNCR